MDCTPHPGWQKLLKRAAVDANRANKVKGCNGVVLLHATVPARGGRRRHVKMLCLGDVHGPNEKPRDADWRVTREAGEITNLQLFQAVVSACTNHNTQLRIFLEEECFKPNNCMTQMIDEIHRQSGLIIVRSELKACVGHCGMCVLGCNRVRVEAVDARLFDRLLYHNLFRKQFAWAASPDATTQAQKWYRFFIEPEQRCAGMWKVFGQMGFEGNAEMLTHYHHRYMTVFAPELLALVQAVGPDIAEQVKSLLVRTHISQFKYELEAEGNVLWVTLQSIIMDYYTLLRMLCTKDDCYAIQAGTAHTIVITLVLMMLTRNRAFSQKQCDKTYKRLVEIVYENHNFDLNCTKAKDVAFYDGTRIQMDKFHNFGEMLELL
jgi:hypothetical protein